MLESKKKLNILQQGAGCKGLSLGIQRGHWHIPSDFILVSPSVLCPRLTRFFQLWRWTPHCCVFGLDDGMPENFFMILPGKKLTFNLWRPWQGTNLQELVYLPWLFLTEGASEAYQGSCSIEWMINSVHCSYLALLVSNNNNANIVLGNKYKLFVPN